MVTRRTVQVVNDAVHRFWISNPPLFTLPALTSPLGQEMGTPKGRTKEGLFLTECT